MNLRKSLILGSIAFTAGLLALPISAEAASGIQISPLTFNLEIPTTASSSGSIIVTNQNDTVLNYVIETENFASVDDQGAVSFAGQEEPTGVTSLADWFTYDSPKEGSLAPRKDTTINFTIDVPEGAEPGGHYAAIFAREVKKNPSGQAEIGIASRVGTLVLVSVPGITTKTAQMSDFTYPKFVWHGPNEFTMKVKNTGTVHYDSKGTVELKSILGQVTTVDMGSHTIIPNSSRTYLGTWLSKYPFGYYNVTASVLDGNNQPVTETGIIWAIPLLIVIPTILGLIILIWLITYLRKHLRFVSKE